MKYNFKLMIDLLFCMSLVLTELKYFLNLVWNLILNDSLLKHRFLSLQFFSEIENLHLNKSF